MPARGSIWRYPSSAGSGWRSAPVWRRRWCWSAAPTQLGQGGAAQGRLLHSRWDEYDTRHVVFQPARQTPAQLEAGYWHAYQQFYTWGNIWRGAAHKASPVDRLRHMAYAGGWKKFEPAWDWVVRAKQVTHLLPFLEELLEAFGKRPSAQGQNATSSAATVTPTTAPPTISER